MSNSVGLKARVWTKQIRNCILNCRYLSLCVGLYVFDKDSRRVSKKETQWVWGVYLKFNYGIKAKNIL